MIPKKEKNCYHLIHHLSYSSGSSLNTIDPVLSSVSYALFDDAIVKIRILGKSALLAKAGVKSAFRLLPIHPSAYNSQCFYFNGAYYYDKCLPIGFFLSCKYFEAFASFLEWTVSFQTDSTHILHNLNDFQFMGQADSSHCLYLFSEFQFICRHFGIPLAEDKSVWPTTCLEFLGITIDTTMMECHFPLAKISRLCTLVTLILSKPKVTVWTLQSLLGLLAFATPVIQIGLASF